MERMLDRTVCSAVYHLRCREAAAVIGGYQLNWLNPVTSLLENGSDFVVHCYCCEGSWDENEDNLFSGGHFDDC